MRKISTIDVDRDERLELEKTGQSGPLLKIFVTNKNKQNRTSRDVCEYEDDVAISKDTMAQVHSNVSRSTSYSS